jgi:hypothetical protein
MFPNKPFVRSEVDTVDLVVTDEALDPLDLRTQLPEHLERLEGYFPDLGIGQL